MLGIKKLLPKIGDKIYQNGPLLLSGIACAGVISTTVLGIRDTMKSKALLEEYNVSFSTVDKETKFEIVKDVLYIYLPTIISGVLTISCIVLSQRISSKRAAALAGLYSISKEALEMYKTNVIKTVGEKTEEKIRTGVMQDKLLNNPPKENCNLYVSSDSVLCYDSQSGRYFNTEYEKIRKIINDLNQRLITEMFIDLNEFYYELGLASTKHGNETGWYIDQGLININYDTMLTEKGIPCIVLDYEVQPRATYN